MWVFQWVYLVLKVIDMRLVDDYVRVCVRVVFIIYQCSQKLEMFKQWTLVVPNHWDMITFCSIFTLLCRPHVFLLVMSAQSFLLMRHLDMSCFYLFHACINIYIYIYVSLLNVFDSHIDRYQLQSPKRLQI